MGHNSVDYVHTSAESLKLAFADREKYLGDMDVIDIPYEGLLSKEYAAERRRLVDPDRASLEFRPGSPERFMENPTPARPDPRVNVAGDADHEGDTSYIAVVDGDRNMVSFEPSLHSGFGTGVVVGDLGSASPAGATTTRWSRVRLTLSRRASGRAAPCRARW